MTDVRLTQRTGSTSAFEAVTLDLLLTPMHDLDTSQELATAVTVALLTDALADPEDTLPDARSTDRRGWWGDLDAQELWNSWPIGSKLWLLSRAKITSAQSREGSTTARIEAYIREALQPLLDRQVASRLDVSVTRVGTERIDASVVLYRGPRASIALRFEDLWNGVIVSAPTA